MPVGGVKARTEFTNPNDKVPKCVYIDSILVLEPYRAIGIGSKLLEYVEEETKKKFIKEVHINVLKNDEKLILWYQHHGFEITGEIKDYYKDHNLAEPDAVSMSKKI